MKKEQIMMTVNKFGLRLKKHSPEILVVAGVIGVVTSAVMACKATTKVSKVLEDAKETLDSVHKCQSDEELASQYTPDDAKKDLAIIYVQTGIKLAKLYAPAVAIGALSLCGIIVSNNILRKRSIALATAYAAVDKNFKKYRNGVVERFGEQIDRELRYGIKAQTIEKTVVDEETGEETKVEETIQVAKKPDENDFARFFDSSCNAWEENAEYNMMFLRAEQNYANDRLNARGYLFLNEVYERLGIPGTKAGQIVGWVRKSDNPEYAGDGYIDFGMHSVHRKKGKNAEGGYEEAILLDFNVDGSIIDLI